MTANRHIFLNIVATYGRSLYALANDLFCGLWSPRLFLFKGGERHGTSNEICYKMHPCDYDFLAINRPLACDNMQREHNYGLDIARIVAMLLVVLLHAVGVFSGFSHSCVAGGILYSWSMCCVDVFALLSGYVGLGASFKLSRIMNLWIQAVFVGVILVSIGSACGVFHPTYKDFGKVFLPISSNAYWYLTAYFFTSLIAPFLNLGIAALSRKRLAIILLLIMLFIIVVPILNPYKGDTYSLRGGYSPVWLILCYVFGGGGRALDNGMTRIGFWMVCTLVAVVVNIFWTGGYTHPAVLMLAFCILMTCSRIRVRSNTAQRVIKVFASSSFGVYLWSTQPMFFNMMIGKLQFVCSWPWYGASATLLGFSVFVYCATVFLERTRMYVFKKFGINHVVKKVDEFLI